MRTIQSYLSKGNQRSGCICLMLSLLICLSSSSNGQERLVQLLVRADDMGASRSANTAAMAAYEQGIVRSVEVMVPGAWFEEAAILLNDVPNLDVGIHLVLTSEWSRVKWRPLTHCPSITDADGYFLPFVWKNQLLPEAGSISESDWDLGEIERELRAQIELALQKIPHISHITEHMGCLQFSDEAKDLASKLAAEYGLSINMGGVRRFPAWGGSDVSAKQKTANLRKEIERLAPGTYLLVEHPAFDDHETQGMGHVGYENVASDRYGVFKALIDKQVVRQVKKSGIRLINYKDLITQ